MQMNIIEIDDGICKGNFLGYNTKDRLDGGCKQCTLRKECIEETCKNCNIQLCENDDGACVISKEGMKWKKK